MRYYYFISYAYKKWKWGRWHIDNTIWDTERPITHSTQLTQWKKSYEVKSGKQKVTVLNVQLLWNKED